MDLLRLRHAYSIVAVLRPTALRRVELHHHCLHEATNGERVAASNNPFDCRDERCAGGDPLVPRAPSQTHEESEKVLDIPFHSTAG